VGRVSALKTCLRRCVQAVLSQAIAGADSDILLTIQASAGGPSGSGVESYFSPDAWVRPKPLLAHGPVTDSQSTASEKPAAKHRDQENLTQSLHHRSAASAEAGTDRSHCPHGQLSGRSHEALVMQDVSRPPVNLTPTRLPC
jgi:hypothetical protein